MAASSSSSSTPKAFDYAAAFDIAGYHTEIVLHKFEERYFVAVSQYGKITNIYLSSNTQGVTGYVEPTQDTYVQHKFGSAEDETEFAIKFVSDKIKLPGFDYKTMEMVFSLGLKEFTQPVMKGVVAAINSMVKETV